MIEATHYSIAEPPPPFFPKDTYFCQCDHCSKGIAWLFVVYKDKRLYTIREASEPWPTHFRDYIWVPVLVLKNHTGYSSEVVNKLARWKNELYTHYRSLGYRVF